MEQKNVKNKVLSGLIWRYAERCGAQGVQLIVSIVLARLLAPSDFGTIGLLTVFISIAEIFISCGFGSSLIQKKDSDKIDFSTVFYFNIFMGIILYVVLFFAAPFIASFYKQPILSPVIRVLSLTLIIGGVNGVQQAYVSKTMQFKRFFWATLGGTLISAGVGILMAYFGFGVWALVAQQLTNQIIDTVILWITVKWRPVLVFSLNRMKRLFSYGWKLLCSSLLDTVYNNLYSLIIGKFYTTSDLGYYNRGKTFPVAVVQNINASINSVLFPALSESQDEKSRFKAMVRRSITTSTFLIFPAMAGLAVISKPLTVVLLTEKWLPAVPFMYFCCFTYAFWPIHTANLQAIKAIGRSDIFLKLEVIKKVVGIIALVITIPMGLIPMMWGRCVTTVISSFLNAYPNKKLINYSYFEQIKDMLPSFILSVVLIIIVYPITFINIAPILQIIIQLVLSVLIYFGLAKLFKLECFEYIVKTVKGFIKKRG